MLTKVQLLQFHLCYHRGGGKMWRGLLGVEWVGSGGYSSVELGVGWIGGGGYRSGE